MKGDQDGWRRGEGRYAKSAPKITPDRSVNYAGNPVGKPQRVDVSERMKAPQKDMSGLGLSSTIRRGAPKKYIGG